MEEDNKYKCSNCGASVRADERCCSYCDSNNKYYKSVKLDNNEIDDDNEDNDEVDFPDVIGVLFSGMMIGSAIKRLGRTIMRPFSIGKNRPPRPPKRHDR